MGDAGSVAVAVFVTKYPFWADALKFADSSCHVIFPVVEACHVGNDAFPVDVNTKPTLANPVVACCNGFVGVVPPHTGAYGVNDVSPVPPPATTAVPKMGSADTPCEINGTPDVAEGAAPFMEDVFDIKTSCWAGKITDAVNVAVAATPVIVMVELSP